MDTEDFAAWISKLCVMEQNSSDAEFAEAVRSFAGECDVEPPTNEQLQAYFQFDDGTLAGTENVTEEDSA